MEYQMAMKANQ